MSRLIRLVTASRVWVRSMEIEGCDFGFEMSTHPFSSTSPLPPYRLPWAAATPLHRRCPPHLCSPHHFLSSAKPTPPSCTWHAPASELPQHVRSVSCTTEEPYPPWYTLHPPCLSPSPLQTSAGLGMPATTPHLSPFSLISPARRKPAECFPSLQTFHSFERQPILPSWQF
jgi:hypothetical protein